MYVIGIDEVGRGALAGPVVVAAVAIPRGARFKNLKDSKKLSPKKREEWFVYIKNEGIAYTTARVYQKRIDTINISGAANLAARKSFSRLLENLAPEKQKNLKIFLDGGLHLSKEKIFLNKFYPRTIIKADEKINAVKLASIVAKVTRDRYMRHLHLSFPKYGLHLHKGYGTKLHRRAIKKYGVSNVHRRSFKIK
ncbi:MAG: ribonuclease HII [Patescibacteria group bacterium]